MSALQMIRGDTAVFDLTITDQDTGDPVNLTNMVLTFTAKRRPTDTDAQAIILKTVDAGIVVDADPTLGIAVLTLEPSDTEDLTDLRTLRWDIQIDNGAGDVRTPLSGRLAIASDQTRASGAS